MRTGLLWLTIGLALIGCKGKPAVVLKNASSPSLAAGWTMASSQDGKISIGVPSGWGKSMPGLMPAMGDASGGTPDPQMGALSDKLGEMQGKDDEDRATHLEAKGIYLTLY